MIKENILRAVDIILAFLIGVLLYSVLEELKAIRRRRRWKKKKRLKTIN